MSPSPAHAETWTGAPCLHHGGQAASFDPIPVDGLLDAAFGTATDLRDTFRTALDHHAAAAKAIPDSWRAIAAARPASTLMPSDSLPGQPDRAVVIAVLDEALPIANPAVSRHLASLWAMGAPPCGEVPFGTEITGTDLAATPDGDRRLRGASGLYARYGINDARTATGRRMRGRTSHGASVMALATAGAGDRHPVLGVSFPADVVEDTSGTLLPFFILCGVLHVVARTRALSAQIAEARGLNALALPVVINLSYGVLAGAKDGSDPLSRALDALCAEDRPPALPDLGPVQIVWPMGNGRQSQSCAVFGAADVPLSLHLLPDDQTPSYVELRADSPEDGSFGLQAGLSLPGTSIWTETPPTPVPGTHADLTLPDGSPVRAYFCRETPLAGPARDMILLAFGPTAAPSLAGHPVRPGRWRLRASAAGPVTIHVQRDDSLEGLGSGGQQARLGSDSYARMTKTGREVDLDPGSASGPIRRNGTANAFAHGTATWRVGGCFQRDGQAVPYSALAGPDGARPVDGDAIAPTDRSRSVAGIAVPGFFGGSRLRVSGTSMAAPQVARALAGLMSVHVAETGVWPDRATLAARLAEIEFPSDPQTSM